MAKITLNYNEIQGRVVDILHKNGLTKYKLAQQIGVDKSSITRIFNGERGWGLDMLASIAVNFDVSLDYIVFGVETDNKKVSQLERELELARAYLTSLLTEKQNDKNRTTATVPNGATGD